MKLNLNKPLTNLRGVVLKIDGEDSKMGDVLATLLMKTPEGDTLRHYDLAVMVRDEKEFEIKPGDLEYLKTFLKDKCPTVSHEIKAPILREIIAQEKPAAS